MNLEAMQALREERERSRQQLEQEKERFRTVTKEQARLWLEEHQMFKDLLDSPDKQQLFKNCRDYLIINNVTNALSRQDNCSADWAKGYITALDTILNIVKEYNDKREKYRI